MSAAQITCRHFLKVTTAAGSGLLIGFYLPESVAASIQPQPWTSLPQGAEINAWLAIDAEDNVTIRVPHTEVGQGALTSVSMMIAEELNVDCTRVRAVSTLRLTLLQFVVGIADIVLVSSVLYLLLPESARLLYLPFLAVYLASVLVGVVSHVPAGLGVLESMLLLLLPQVQPAQLLASVLLYRVIYEVIPLVAALGLWGGYELLADDGARVRLLRQ